MTRQIIGLILLMALAFLIVPASANILTVSNAQVSTIGNTATITVILDEAPNGLSGYNLSVSLSDPGVAEITSMTYPAWSTYNDNSSLPADSAWVKAYDGGSGTYGNVAPGATNIPFVNITIRGDAGGVTTVNVVPIQIDEDGAGAITPTLVAGTFTVDQPVSPPVAEFSANPVTGNAPLSVQFTDQSTGTGLSWAWDFNNDGTIDSTVQNPSYSYTSAGTYPVNLTVTNAAGSDSEVKSGYIVVHVVPPSANFIRTPQSGPAPLSVQFTDNSAGGTPTSWAWDFTNDGSIDSTLQNPVFVYNTAGTFTVNFTATNAGGSSSSQKTVTVTGSGPAIPVVNFDADTRSGPAPLTVHFTDNSTNTPTSWAWDFTNDGTIDSTEQNPFHTYTTPGTYQVNLTASNTAGSAYRLKGNFIEVTVPNDVNPVVDFSADSRTGTAPFTVHFTDLTVTNPTAWAWDFTNDGTIDSTAQNPSFTYSAAGTYQVNLTATNATGTKSRLKANFITVTAPAGGGAPVAGFSAIPLSGDAPLDVQFTDASTGSPTAWGWDFGDSPVNVYVTDLDAGLVKVIYPNGTVGVLAGGHTFSLPSGIDVDPEGNVYVAEYAGTIYKILPDDTLTTFFPGGSGVTGVYDLAVDQNGNVYIADADGYAVKKIDPSGTVTTLLSFGGGSPTPQNVDVDAFGNVYTAEGVYNQKIYKIFPNGTSVELGGSVATGLAVDYNGTVYCSDINIIHRIFSDGTRETLHTYAMAQQCVAIDDFTGNIYSTDFYPSNTPYINVRYANGTVGTLGSGFTNPFGIAVKLADSISQSPSHTYTTPGTYKVSLIASNAGGSNMLTKNGYITAYDPGSPRVYLVPQSNVVTTGNSQVYSVFVTTLPTGLSGSNITYTLDSPSVGTITAYTLPSWAGLNRTSGVPADNVWIEGVDLSQLVQPGATSVSLGTITVRADTPGKTAIHLTVNELDPDNNGTPIVPAVTNGEMTVYTPVSADFTADNLTGYAPLHVRFTNPSVGSPGPLSWAWDFNNDGVVDSTVQNPEHDFIAAGKYTVNLTVTGTYNSDTETKVQYIWAKYNVAIFPGYTNYPTDPDFDGLYEDINGNGRFDFDDVVAFFQNMQWIRDNTSVGIVPYDFNGNGRIDYDDVVVLYLEVLRN
jgi:PKD repeat protein